MINLNDLTAELAANKPSNAKHSQAWTKRELNLLRKQAKKSVNGAFSKRQFILKIKELKRAGESIEGINDNHTANAICVRFEEFWQELSEE